LGLLAGAVASRKATRLSVSDDGRYFVGPTLDSIGPYLPSSWHGLLPDTALNFITIYQCVRVMSHTFAQIPLVLYRRRADGGKDRADDHPLYRTLHESPNPDMTSFTWRRLMMVHLMTWGNHFSEITVDGLGRPLLYPVRPDRVEVTRENGVKTFWYLGDDGRKRFEPGTVFHVQALSSDGLVGRSPITDLRRSIRLGRTAEEFGESFFRNNARPATIVKHPSTLSNDAVARLAAQMEALRGSGNAGKTVVLEEGTDFAEIGIPPDDAQFMETRLFQKREIAGAFGVSMHKIGDSERAGNESTEQANIEHITDTMMPYFVNVEEEASIQLIEEDDVFAEFLVDGYLRGDAESRNRAYATRWQHGTLSINDWRAKENDNPIVGGDAYFVPANYVPLDRALEPPKPVAVPSTNPPGETGQDAAPPDQTGSPTLRRVKSAEVRCENCGKMLAETATAPYRIVCARCKEVTEAA